MAIIRLALLAGAGLGLAAFMVACASSRTRYESAAYTLLKSDETFEIRDYPELKVVATAMDPSKDQRDDRFMRLFRYIDGNNVSSQKVAMTTPVFMTGNTPSGSGATDGPKMNFVVPAAVAASGPPKPLSEDVKLESMPARRVAVVRFSGSSNRSKEEEKLNTLRAWMVKHDLTAEGEPILAYYDPPWTPGPMRRNEILVPLKK